MRLGRLRGVDPVPPLLVADGWDVTFFRSQLDLGSVVEPWYVDERYRAWGALGRPLELVLEEDPALTGRSIRL